MGADGGRSNTVYLSLGSNIAPEVNLPAAIKLLAELTELVAVSSVWETRPVGFLAQANFLNAAAVVCTPFSPSQFHEQVIRVIEQQRQRVRGRNKNGPRTIDLDIILFNRQILNLAGRHIPNPDLLERPFVALPLAEIAPDYQHPETGHTLRDIANTFIVNDEEMQLRPDVSRALKAISPNRPLTTINY